MITDSHAQVRHGCDRLTAWLFVAGELCVVLAAWWAGGGRLFALSCGFMAAVALLCALRASRPRWRLTRHRAATVDIVCLSLMLIPSTVASRDPMVSVMAVACCAAAYMAFLGFREAFTAGGVFSPSGFAGVVGAGAVGIVAMRLTIRLVGSGIELPWYALVPRDDAGAFAHLYDFLLVAAWPIMVLVGGRTRGWRRVVWRVGAGVVVVGVVLSFCRAAWLALAVEACAIAWLDRASRRELQVGMVLCGVIALAVPGVTDRLGTMLGGWTQTNSERQELWAASLALIVRSPILGYGLGTFPGLYAEMGGVYSERAFACPHNVFLHVAVACGLPALAVFLVWVRRLLAVAWQGWRAGGERAMFWLGAWTTVIGILVFGLVDL